MASSISAAGAYAAVQKMGASALAPTLVSKPSMGDGSGGQFASMLQQFVGGTADSARKAESAMTQATAGRADLVEVVTAVAESEAALETLVAVRDKVIAAYEEIMRMPI
ncbi:MAG: flagellar hook-basal body complex protein FliE [Beijerinckiaceae bacterium]